MAIHSPKIDQLAAQLAQLDREEVLEVFRKTLDIQARQEAKPQASAQRFSELREFLEREIWPQIPSHLRGKGITKQEREEILGYGPEGV